MRSRLTGLAASAALVAACRTTSPDSPAPAAPASAASSHVSSQPSPSEVHFSSDGRSLRGYVFKPNGTGSFPALIYNHGSEPHPSVEDFADLVAYFQEHGFVVFLPFRRGQGGSEGPYWDDEVKKYPDDERPQRIVDVLDAQNADVVAAVRYLREQPYVDGTRVAVAGCSFGGIETLLTAEKTLGLVAAVDFAGGAMAWDESPPLQQRMKLAARQASVPVFFVQAENDFNTAPSKVLAAEMEVSGKPHCIKIFPPHGTTHSEGHGQFCRLGMKEWGDDVLAFLRSPKG